MSWEDKLHREFYYPWNDEPDGGDSVSENVRSDKEYEKRRYSELVARQLMHLTKPYRGIDDTPKRVAKMWVDELTNGYGIDVSTLLGKTFPNEGYGGMVVIKDIPLVSVCEHHLVPFVGYAHVGYLPGDSVVGLSKIARTVNAYARRLQIQERVTKQVADAIEEHLKARGVIVVIEAEHLCMTIRGVQAPGTKTVTSEVRGSFNTNNEGEKEEFLRLVGKSL